MGLGSSFIDTDLDLQFASTWTVDRRRLLPASAPTPFPSYPSTAFYRGSSKIKPSLKRSTGRMGLAFGTGGGGSGGEIPLQATAEAWLFFAVKPSDVTLAA